MRLFVVMGVAGCGKSTVGEGVAAALGGVYLEGDAFHPEANIEKMSRGEALTDADRWPWLEHVAQELASRQGLVFAGCSALKRSYRDLIVANAGEPVTFLHLAGSKELIGARMAERSGHFMPTSLLESQFAALEVPQADENAVSVDISGSSQEVIDQLVKRLR